MQIKYLPASHTQRVALVVLETPEELALTNDELMRMVDNRAGVVYDPANNNYRLTGEGFGPDRYFSGSVQLEAEPGTKLVTVYID